MEIPTLDKTMFEDAKKLTRATRVELGFQSKESWRNAPALFDEHTLKIQGHPVMEDWEDSYMEALAAIAASNGGTVLEVGFGMGISARKIQQHTILQHLIIEANQGVFEKLIAFQKEAARPVVPFLGFWEEIVATIPSGSISGILFDTYPLCEEEIHQNHFPFFKEAYRLLAPDGIFTYYSDEVEDFSPLHRELLQEAGFSRIEKKLCVLETPKECVYWRSRTMIAPIIRK